MKGLIYSFIFLLIWPAAGKASHVSIATTLYRPFMSLDDNGHISGIYHEYLTELTKKSGLQAAIEPMPLSRVLNHASKGTHDVLMFVSGAPEAERHYLELARFGKVQIILISTEKKLDFSKEAFVVGKATGSLCPVFSKEQEKKVRFLDYHSISDALKLLSLHRINAICTSRTLFNREIQKSPYAHLKTYEFPEYHHEYMISLFVHKRLHPKKISSLSKAVAELEQKKTLPNLYRKYGIEEPSAL